jgi:5-methylcytosine-specific restriction endonuclease McrA
MYSRSRKHAKPNCERCGTTDRLHVHHRDGDITNNDPANFETLCVLCHNRHHFAGVSRTATPDSGLLGTRSSPRSPNGSVGGSSRTSKNENG